VTATSPSSYVAIGDSFTAGVPGADSRWPDELAALLGVAEYRNLGVAGATSAEVAAGQLDECVALGPDLVTVICGANDVLRRVRPDVDGYGERLAEILDRLRSALPGAAILTATSPEGWRFMDLGPRTQARVTSGIRHANALTRAAAAARGIPCLDVVDHPGLADPANFSSDGLHPSAIGHRRAAAEFADVLRAEFGIDVDYEGRQ
jgi:lysophospholipase L1-like esterase